MTPPAALLLDLDGTLLDYEHAAHAALCTAVGTAGLTDVSRSSAMSLWRDLRISTSRSMSAMPWEFHPMRAGTSATP